MGNLGKYQDIVVAAKEVGGVDSLIRKIEAGAVAKAAPKLLRKGAALGALGMAAVSAVAAVVTRSLANKKSHEAVAEDAKMRLKAHLEESRKSVGVTPEGIKGVAEGDEESMPPGAVE